MKNLSLTRTPGTGGRPGSLVRFAIVVGMVAGSCLSPAMAQGRVESISGLTEPINDVILSLPMTGTVAKIFFQEGDYVKKGAAILALDSELETLEVERRKLLWENKAEVNAAVVRVQILGSQLKSSKELYEATGSISRDELEKQQLEYELAVAEKVRLEDYEERERIEYRIAVEQLNKRSLVAPFSGIITELMVDVGETREENNPLAHLVDTSQGLFVCTVEEPIGRTLKNGSSVDLEIQSGAAVEKIKGRIIFVDPIVDPASGLQKVKVRFPIKDGDIRPGVTGTMLVTVSGPADKK
ncbi:MAG: efflux RND transporter periplasmic adaptor subunit [Desulfuromonadales bacterium]|nr:efflux RND transporter periplasmic adaptor subunit [Desulfuromonadales bacterium]